MVSFFNHCKDINSPTWNILIAYLSIQLRISGLFYMMLGLFYKFYPTKNKSNNNQYRLED